MKPSDRNPTPTRGLLPTEKFKTPNLKFKAEIQHEIASIENYFTTKA